MGGDWLRGAGTLYAEECRGFAAALPSAGAWGPFEAPM
jgi:hypothetical protein